MCVCARVCVCVCVCARVCVRAHGSRDCTFAHSSVLWFVLCSLQETYEAKRKEFLGDLQRKEEEMRQMFVSKVKETEAELKEKEKEVRIGGVSCIGG